MNITAFRKAFKKAVPNLDEGRVQINKAPSATAKDVAITIIVRGRLTNMYVYNKQYEIDLWANHFIDFFNTGKFDRNAYSTPYSGKDSKPLDIIKRTPLGRMTKDRNDCDYDKHSPKFNGWMNSFRKEHGDHGFTFVPKPLDDSIDILD